MKKKWSTCFVLISQKKNEYTRAYIKPKKLLFRKRLVCKLLAKCHKFELDFPSACHLIPPDFGGSCPLSSGAFPMAPQSVRCGLVVWQQLSLWPVCLYVVPSSFLWFTWPRDNVLLAYLRRRWRQKNPGVIYRQSAFWPWWLLSPSPLAWTRPSCRFPLGTFFDHLYTTLNSG